MPTPFAIKFDHVSKSFPLSVPTIRNTFSTNKSDNQFVAVNDVSLQIPSKTIVGIFGGNGSGKSTLLRLMAGIITPDEGTITVAGSVAPVLELGAGLHPELTGRENCYIYGATLGMSSSYLDRIIPEASRIANVVDFLDYPLKKFSSGMKAKLAFSLAIQSQASIILLDEVFSVGDQNFKMASVKLLPKLKKKATIVIVSHSFEFLRNNCDFVLAMHQGKIIGSLNQLRAHQLSEVLTNALVKNSIKITIYSDSMMPTFGTNDQVIITKIAFNKLKVGDIIVVSFPNTTHLVAHRIIGTTITTEGKGFLTRGDASKNNDGWIVNKHNYYAKVIRKA